MHLLVQLARKVDRGEDFRALLLGVTRDDRFNQDVLCDNHVIHWMYRNDTPLHLMAAGHHGECIRKLVGLGIDVNDRGNRRGATPLHYAADAVVDHAFYRESDQEKTIRALVQNGADVDATDKNGATPLFRAIRCRSYIAVKTLMELGSDMRSTNSRGTDLRTIATICSGRGGSAHRRAKENQAKILRMLRGVT